jgi:peptidoglycan/LPS O-acetylase OafA/YrhL
MSHSLPRRYDLDWLRVAACYLLLFFHVVMVFNPAPFYHIRNDQVSFAMLVLAGFISLWHMPLLFFLAGWSLLASLEKRGTRSFLRERLRKLALPLLAGCLFLAPGIKYFELRSGMDLNYKGLRVAAELQDSFEPVVPSGLPLMDPFEESFLEFLATFFTQSERFTWSHLWFVAYLLTFTLIYFPLFRRVVRWRKEFHAPSRAWVYAPIAPLVLIQLTMRERWPGPYNLFNDWANFAYFSTFLWAGFLLARYSSLGDAISREWRRALLAGTLAVLVLLLAVLGVLRSSTVLMVGSAVAGWCFVVGLIGAASARLRRGHQALPYLSQSAYPVYILHQPVIVFLGFGIVQLPLGVLTKFALLLSAATAATLLIFHLLVRPFALPRVLLGMKPQPRPSSRRATPALLARHAEAFESPGRFVERARAPGG